MAWVALVEGKGFIRVGISQKGFPKAVKLYSVVRIAFGAVRKPELPMLSGRP